MNCWKFHCFTKRTTSKTRSYFVVHLCKPYLSHSIRWL